MSAVAPDHSAIKAGIVGGSICVVTAVMDIHHLRRDGRWKRIASTLQGGGDAAQRPTVPRGGWAAIILTVPRHRRSAGCRRAEEL
jgi:hypothetical protein